MILAAAQRLEHINEYYFSQKLEQIRVMNAQGRNVINLGIGSPDLPPSAETIKAAVKSISSSSSHGYASYRGTMELRTAIAQWYQKTYGITLDAQREVLPLLGSKEGLFYISMAFLNPGDKVLVPNPGYPAYTSVSQLAGAEVVYYNLSEENQWRPNFKELEKSNLEKVKLMWVNYPHMPTGQAGNESLFQELIEFARGHKILICHDNPYSMVLNTEKPLSLLRFDKDRKYSLELNSFSKAFNMAGWRIGILLAAPEIIDTVIKVKSNVDSGMFLPVQVGAIEALNNSQDWHEERNKIYGERRRLALQIFDHLGLSYSLSQVGLFVWGRAPEKIKNVEEMVNEILEKNAVFLTPGFIFGSAGERYVRCSLCASKEQFESALERLEGIV